jgi:hypothetical protein
VRNSLIASAFALLAAIWIPSAYAQEVQVDVDSSPIGMSVPPLYEFGGGAWRVPKVMPWVAPRISELRGRAGTFRAALSWEVLAPSQSLEDLQTRLANYQLNKFLKQMKAKGAEVIISLDGMPKWLAVDKSEKKLADGPAWAKSVPSSHEQWASVVEIVVAHFNGELGLDALYEVWNEPDWSLRGSVEQYLELYRWSVVGAKRADPRARMAGPALSDWLSPGAAGAQFFLQSFFDYAARTPVPEAGLKRLPIDAVTWHAFYRDHTMSYELAATNIRKWLAAAGYAGETKLILDEWNVASAEPPYPEGDLNGGYIGAIHVTAALIAMDEAGIDRQTFQMMVDPGSQGYSGGAFTPLGASRPNFNAFRMFASLSGKELPVRSSQKWVRSVAFADQEHVYLVIAVAPPSDFMLARGVLESLPIEDHSAYLEMKEISKEAVLGFLFKNGDLPRSLSPASLSILQRARDQLVRDRQERDSWKNGIALHINLDPGLGVKANSRHFIFDRKHAPDSAEMDRATRDLQSILLGSVEKAQRELDASDISPDLKQKYLSAIKDTFDANSVIEGSDPTSQAALRRADRVLTQDFANRLSALDRADRQRLVADPIETDGPTIKLQSDGVALHYLVFDR